jgi:hypothetical protein
MAARAERPTVGRLQQRASRPFWDPERLFRYPERKKPRHEPGLESLIAVITARLLLREEKQGTTTLRLSSADDFIR